jgi:hypothetical protein
MARTLPVAPRAVNDKGMVAQTPSVGYDAVAFNVLVVDERPDQAGFHNPVGAEGSVFSIVLGDLLSPRERRGVGMCCCLDRVINPGR